MNKRDDIQWLRAAAIFSVLLFHIWPKCFPYGYLGVDIFFVISGYLMTKILCKPATTNPNLFNFYLRRIKRIFPTCLFVITLTLFIGSNVLLYTHFWSMLIEGVWSIFFINNLSPFFSAKHYFDMASEYKFMLHTWSLGVEVQFYLIAPFLLKFIKKQENPMKFVLIGIALSLISQLLIPLPHITFGLVFCRIWQFLSGTAAFYQHSNNYHPLDKFSNKKCEKRYCLIWIILIIICCNPLKFGFHKIIDSVLRIFVTVLVGRLLTLGEMNVPKIPDTLNKFLVYIGDASYSLYLIHWPIIVIFKYFGILNVWYYLLVIGIIILTTLIIHETFEKTLILQSWTINGVVIFIFYASILSAVAHLRPLEAPDEIEFLDTEENTYNPILANEKEAASCWKTYYPCDNGTFLNEMFKPELLTKPNCSYTLTQTSNKTIVILGNSFALNQSKGILKAIKAAKTKFNKAYLLVVYGCNVLTGKLILQGHPHCTKVERMHSNFLEALKPDIIIFSGRFDHIGVLRQPIPPEGEITKHNNYQQLLNIIKYANYTQKFIIIEPNPMDTKTRKYNSPLTISEDLLAGRDIKQYMRPVELYNATNYRAWEWVKTVVKECKNCKIVPTRDLFCDDKICNFVDIKSKLGLYCDESHITPRTSLKLIPRIKDAIDN